MTNILYCHRKGLYMRKPYSHPFLLSNYLVPSYQSYFIIIKDFVSFSICSYPYARLCLNGFPANAFTYYKNGAYCSVFRVEEIFLFINCIGEVDHDWYLSGNALNLSSHGIDDGNTAIKCCRKQFPVISPRESKVACI